MDVEALIQTSDRLCKEGKHSEGAAQARLAIAAVGATAGQQSRAQALLALHQLRLGDFESAIQVGLMALAHEVGGGDLAAQSQLHSTVSFAYFSSKLHQQALRHVVLALETARECGDLLAECRALSRAGMIYEALGEGQRGLEFGRQALASARSLNDGEAMFAALNNLTSTALAMAKVQVNQDENPSALLHLALADIQAALALAVAQGNHHREAMARSNMSGVMMRLHRWEEAEAAMQQALAMARAEGYRALELGIECDLVELHDLKGEHAQALRLGQSLLTRLDKKQDTEVALILHATLHKLHKTQGEFEAALHEHEQLFALKLLEVQELAGLQSRILINRLELGEARQQAELSRQDAVMQRRRAEDLDRQAHSDPLTGLLNRRFVDSQLPLLVQRAHDRGLPLAAAMIDIDHFKAVNDTHGHAVGDRVLIELANLLRQATRGSDIAARLGGEEFLVVLVDTPLDQAVDACERLRLTVRQHPWHMLVPGLTCSVSLGLTVLEAEERMSVWLTRADELLYAAKRAGRDRLVCKGL